MVYAPRKEPAGDGRRRARGGEISIAVGVVKEADVVANRTEKMQSGR
jgi:hypothetical protein